MRWPYGEWRLVQQAVIVQSARQYIDKEWGDSRAAYRIQQTHRHALKRMPIL